VGAFSSFEMPAASIQKKSPVPLCFAEEHSMKYSTFWKLDTSKQQA